MKDSDFNEEEYLRRYPDVAAAVENGGFKNGYDHFVRCGKAEGRIYVLTSKPIGGRNKFFATMPDINNVKSLEIAPWFNPILIGDNVSYFDAFDKPALIKNAEKIGLDTSKIPEINYVHHLGDMSIIKDKFNLVFSSHNIEHQVDLVNHLKQVANLLEKDGKFYIAIPDKRYCFDHYIPVTPLSEVLATHWSNPKTHSLQTVLAMKCETTHNDPRRHWQGDHGQIASACDVSCYNRALEEFNNSKGSYIDVHKWRFIPESFYQIVEDLYKMNLQPLRVEKVYRTGENDFEFFAVLYKPE